VIICEEGMWQELLIVDRLPACSRSCTMERQKSNVFHSVLFVCWQISIDYQAVDLDSFQNPIESDYQLCLNMSCILK